MKWRPPLAAILFVVIAAGVVGGWILLEVRAARKISPPIGVNDIHSFLEWRPQTDAFRIVQQGNGPDHLMATGAYRQWASGPSAYVFDPTGVMIDWSYDIGDDPSFDRRWSAQRSQQSSTIVLPAEVQDWLESDE